MGLRQHQVFELVSDKKLMDPLSNFHMEPVRPPRADEAHLLLN